MNRKEVKHIISAYTKWKEESKAMAMAVVINVEQSSYRRPGARMLICENGQWRGGISGGCLEGDVLHKAQRVIYNGRSTVVSYDTREEGSESIGIGLGCNGKIDILISPLVDEHIDHLGKCIGMKRPSIFVHLIKKEAIQLLDVESIASFSKDASSVLQTKKSKVFIDSSGVLERFIEYIPPILELYVFGRQYDVIAVLQLAQQLGWKTILVDKINKLSREQIELADEYFTIDKLLSYQCSERSAAILMAHDYNRDKQNAKLIRSLPFFYVGMLGPRKRTERILSELIEEGNSLSQEVIYGPAGLDTGASTPQEIAVSMLAEIRTVLEGREGGHLRTRKGSIYSS